MKKYLSTALALLLALCLLCSACAPAAQPESSEPTAVTTAAPIDEPAVESAQEPEPANTLTPGTYTASANGFANLVEVTMTVSEDAILECTAVGPVETNGVGQVAIQHVPAQIVETQSVGIDVYTGATFTFNGIIAAAKDCIAQAGGDIESWSAYEEAAPQQLTIDTDVVIVGGGLSGLSAAVSAAEAGAEVVLVDKLAFIGGNSALSTGGFLLTETSLQKACGVEDSAEDFIAFGMETSDNTRDIVQLEMIAYRGAEVFDWLVGHGAEFKDTVKKTTGCPIERGHNAAKGTYQIIASMWGAAEELGVNIYLRTAATELLTDAVGNVTGILAVDEDGNSYTINASGTILAAGGFAGNSEKIEEYWGLSGLTYVGTKGVVGDMIDAAASIGAEIRDMDFIKTTSTVDVTKGILLTGGMLSAGAILVDENGNRFTDEAGNKTGLGNTIMELDQPYVVEIFDQAMADQVSAAAKYKEQGILNEAESIEALAEAMGLPVDNVVAAVSSYNEAVKAGVADEFGRIIYTNPIENGPYYAARVYPGLTSTAGGVVINSDCGVLKEDGTAIGNLYAVGEMVSGYRALGYVGGDSLVQDAVTGKVAGEVAAAAANK